MSPNADAQTLSDSDTGYVAWLSDGNWSVSMPTGGRRITYP